MAKNKVEAQPNVTKADLQRAEKLLEKAKVLLPELKKLEEAASKYSDKWHEYQGVLDDLNDLIDSKGMVITFNGTTYQDGDRNSYIDNECWISSSERC